MVLASEIITSARDILSDPTPKRYGDALLLRLLNDGLKNFALATSFSRQKAFIAIEDNISVYDMSTYAISIDRIQYINRVLEVKSEEEMDAIALDWELHTGTEPKYVIFNNLRQGVFKIYPRVTELAADIIDQNQVYGGLIDITITDDLLYLPGITNVAFGAVKYLAVYYVETPPTISLLTDTIRINPVHIPPLAAYVSGQALRIDQDSQNRSFGAEQLAIYNDYIGATYKNEQGSNNSFSKPTIPYRGFV
jgi:hypothetical protein